MIFYCDETTIGRCNSTAAGAANASECASTLSETDHDGKHAGISEDRKLDAFKKRDSHVIMMNREELSSLVQVKVRSAVDATEREKMKSKSLSLFEETTWDVFTTGYCAATKSVKNPSFSFVEDVISKVKHRRALNDTLNHSLNGLTRSDTFIKVLVEKFVNHPGSLTTVAAFVGQRVINTEKKKLKREPQETEEILLPQESSTSAPAETTSDEESGAGSSCRGHRDCNGRKYRIAQKTRMKRAV